VKYRYHLHGLALASNGRIPGLVAVQDDRPADLSVWLDRSPLALHHTSEWETWFESPFQLPNGQPALRAFRSIQGSYYRLLYHEGIDFVIDSGVGQVWANWPPERCIADVPSYLLGPVIAIILRLRGVVCLHASAIVADGCAVAFVGPKGAGKSTVAAALAVRGARVIADDTIALRRRDGEWIVAPGYPRIRLWPGSAHAIGQTAGAASALLPPGTSGSATRYHLDLTANGLRFQDRPLPLDLIYLLDASTDGAVAAVPVRPAEAFGVLVNNSFATRVLTSAARAQEFDALARLAGTVPVRRLRRATGLGRLAELCDFVMHDVQAVVSDAHPAIAAS
jgi:hypothetical protein